MDTHLITTLTLGRREGIAHKGRGHDNGENEKPSNLWEENVRAETILSPGSNPSPSMGRKKKSLSSANRGGRGQSPMCLANGDDIIPSLEDFELYERKGIGGEVSCKRAYVSI